MAHIFYRVFVYDSIVEGGWSAGQDGSIAGTTGKNLPIDAFEMSALPFPTKFDVYIAYGRWLGWMDAGAGYLSGVHHAITALRFSFPNGIPAKYSLLCNVHMAFDGWLGWKSVVDETEQGNALGSAAMQAVALSLVEHWSSDGAEKFEKTWTLLKDAEAQMFKGRLSPADFRGLVSRDPSVQSPDDVAKAMYEAAIECPVAGILDSPNLAVALLEGRPITTDDVLKLATLRGRTLKG